MSLGRNLHPEPAQGPRPLLRKRTHRLCSPHSSAAAELRKAEQQSAPTTPPQRKRLGAPLWGTPRRFHRKPTRSPQIPPAAEEPASLLHQQLQAITRHIINPFDDSRAPRALLLLRDRVAYQGAASLRGCAKAWASMGLLSTSGGCRARRGVCLHRGRWYKDVP